MKIIPIYKAEAFLIPLKHLEADEIDKAQEKFTYRFYEQAKCKRCDNLPERHNDICDSCSAFTGVRSTAKIVQKGGNKRDFLSLPVGNSKEVKRWLTSIGKGSHYEVLPRHPEAERFSRPVKLILKPYDYQVEAVEVLFKKKRGILESPPRSGKTVMATALMIKVGVKTLILGAQLEWLNQFMDTFFGTETQVGFTNMKRRQAKICRTFEDFRDTDICLSTFSAFMSKNGKMLLEQIRELFGMVIVDECHFTPALQTSRITARFNTEYFIGLSGTVERKQTDEIQIAHDLIGPIIHTCEVERLKPKLIPFFTNVKFADPKGGQAGFTYFQTRLESSTPRRQMLVKEIIKYARAGHLVLVPLTRVNSILKWTQEINAETEQPGFALPFFGGLKKDKRAEIVQTAREFRCRVVVGNIALLSTGLNIPRASCLFETSMTSNIPKCDQRVSRVLTPMPGKPQPLIVYVLDDSDLMRKCRRNEFWNGVIPRFDPIINRDDKSAIMTYFAGKEQKSFSKADLSEGM